MKISKITVLFFILLSILVSCESREAFILEEPFHSSEEALKTFSYPDWIEDITPKIEDGVYYPNIYERAYTLSDARKIYSEYIYLIEKYKDTYKENDNYYGWLKYTATMGLNLEAYETSDTLARTIEVLRCERKNKKYESSFNDMSPIICISKYYMGNKEYAMGFYDSMIKDNIDKLNPFMLHSLAYIMHLEKREDEARRLYDEVLVYQDKKYANRLVTSALEACSYYYKMGDYDKIIEISDTYLSLGEDPEDAYPHLYADKKYSKHFRENWMASYKQLTRYKGLAKKAKDGHFIEMTSLSDGIYKSLCTSYKGSPFHVVVIIKDHKIDLIEAFQTVEGDEVLDDRPFGAVDIMPKKIADRNDYYVDAISSATVSSNSIKLGVMDCLLEASE